MKVCSLAELSPSRTEASGTTKRRWFVLAASTFCLFLAYAVGPIAGQGSAHNQNWIDLSRVGFHPLSASARLESQANMSMDFLDDTHVLLTFNPKKMFTRLPDCPPSHDDRIIHAMILAIPSGQVVKEADWYM